jgi:hypothetical protein
MNIPFRPKMIVVAPACSEREVSELAEAGADEFFCGVYLETWSPRLGKGTSMNRRAPYKGQVQSVDELARMAKCARQLGREISLTFNRDSHTQGQYDVAWELAQELRQSTGIDRFIVTDPALVAKLAEQGFHVTVSCIANVLNSDAAGFFEELGACRIILPEELVRADEICGLIRRNPRLQIEVFATPNGCMHMQGLCGIDHDLDAPPHPLLQGEVLSFAPLIRTIKRTIGRPLASVLRLRRQPFIWPCALEHFRALPLDGLAPDPDLWEKLESVFSSQFLRGPDCTFCNILFWHHAGVSAVKVLARQHPLEIRVRRTRAISHLCHLAATKPETEAFRSEARAAFRSAFAPPCHEDRHGACGYEWLASD